MSVVLDVNQAETPLAVAKALVGRRGSALVESSGFSIKFRSPHTKVGTEASRWRRERMRSALKANSPRLEVKVKKLKRGTIGSEGRVPTELSVATRTHGERDRGTLVKTAYPGTVDNDSIRGGGGKVVVVNNTTGSAAEGMPFKRVKLSFLATNNVRGACKVANGSCDAILPGQ